jgi:hypothetical protein
MPEIPQLKKFPYVTEKRCAVCHPASLAEPPYYECRFETAYAGTQVIRNLHCPNCDACETDVFDVRLGRVTLDHAMDIAAARGART